MSLQDVKLLLGIKDNSRDDLLNLLISNAQTQLLGRLQVLDVPILAIPPSLEYIIPELVVRRYNRIGSEGMSSETVEGHSATYDDNDLLAYEFEIDRFLNTIRKPKTGIVRFI